MATNRSPLALIFSIKPLGSKDVVDSGGTDLASSSSSGVCESESTTTGSRSDDKSPKSMVVVERKMFKLL